MIELLKAIDEARHSDVPLSRNVELGKAFSDWLWANTDSRYVAQNAAGVALMARCDISLSSLYRARAAYLAQLTKRRGR